MFGVGIAGGGDLYSALLFYCLVLSINLKLGAALARSRGWRDWAVPNLRFLWPFLTLTLLLTGGLTLGLAWLSSSAIFGLAIGILLPVFGVGAVFYLLATEPVQRRKIKTRELGGVAALSAMSIALSAGLCIFYFIAKYPFLIALVLASLYSTRFNYKK
jgi:energy-converting hydrogenase Eha subunit G